MTGDDARFIAQLGAELAACLPRWLGKGAELDSSDADRAPRVLKRKYSYLFQFPARSGNGARLRLCVKIPRRPGITSLRRAVEGPDLQREAAVEFAALQRIAAAVEAANHPGLCAISVIGFCPGFNAVVMQSLSLRPLKRWYADPRLALGLPGYWGSFEGWLVRAGEWLRVFHDANEVGPDPSDSRSGPGPRSCRVERCSGAALARQAEAELDGLSAVIRPFDLTVLRDLFAQAAKSLDGVETPVAVLHMDFNLGNIFVTPEGKVGALDPNEPTRGPAYIDLARLITDPLTRKAQVLTSGRYFPPASAERFGAAVLSGYFRESTRMGPPRAGVELNRPDGRLLAFHCALAVVAKWRMDEEALGSRSPMTRRLVTGPVRRYFGDLAAAYLSRQAIPATGAPSTTP